MGKAADDAICYDHNRGYFHPWVAWLSTFIFSENNKVTSSEAMLTAMNQELRVNGHSKDDSMKIYSDFLAKAKSAGIDTTEIVSSRDVFANVVTIAPGAEADTTGNGGTLAENGKEAVTEAGVKTNAKPRIAQANTNVNGGEKPASDANAVGAKPAEMPKKDEEKVAGSVKTKVTVNSKAPAAGNAASNCREGLPARDRGASSSVDAAHRRSPRRRCRRACAG